MTRKKTTLLILVALFAGTLLGRQPAVEAQLDRLLKTVGVGAAVLIAVDKYSGEIDKFINRLSGNKARPGVATKVVPILSVGKGTYAGAAQVTGPPKQVDLVSAVALVEGEARLGIRVQGRALIPVSSRNVADLNSLARVPGVGLSATIEIKL